MLKWFLNEILSREREKIIGDIIRINQNPFIFLPIKIITLSLGSLEEKQQKKKTEDSHSKRFRFFFYPLLSIHFQLKCSRMNLDQLVSDSSNKGKKCVL